MILRSVKLALTREKNSSFERLLKNTQEIIRKSVLFKSVWLKQRFYMSKSHRIEVFISCKW